MNLFKEFVIPLLCSTLVTCHSLYMLFHFTIEMEITSPKFFKNKGYNPIGSWILFIGLSIINPIGTMEIIYEKTRDTVQRFLNRQQRETTRY